MSFVTIVLSIGDLILIELQSRPFGKQEATNLCTEYIILMKKRKHLSTSFIHFNLLIYVFIYLFMQRKVESNLCVFGNLNSQVMLYYKHSTYFSKKEFQRETTKIINHFEKERKLLYLCCVKNDIFTIWKNAHRPCRKEIWLSIKCDTCIRIAVIISKKGSTIVGCLIIDMCLKIIIRRQKGMYNLRIKL